MTAAKLRLSIQSALRTESAMLDERSPKGEESVLFGGNVVRF
jgi:hypothetical protein